MQPGVRADFDVQIHGSRITVLEKSMVYGPELLSVKYQQRWPTRRRVSPPQRTHQEQGYGQPPLCLTEINSLKAESRKRWNSYAGISFRLLRSSGLLE